MRVAIVGAGSRGKTEGSIVLACRSLGHEALQVNVPGWSRLIGPLAPELIGRRITAFAPDRVVLTVRAIRLGDRQLRNLTERFSTAFWYFDYQMRPDAVTLARLAGMTFVTYTHHLVRLRRDGVSHVLFMPQGVDPTVDRPATALLPKYDCDVSFIGSGQHSARHEALRMIAAAARLQVRGPGWSRSPHGIPVVGGEIRGAGFARAVAGAAISLGLHALPAQRSVQYSASNRMWKVMGCGGFFLGEYSEGIERFAEDSEHCGWFRSSEEMLERLRYFLVHPDQRRRIAERGRAHALAHHTYAHRLGLLLAERGYDLAG